jgi:biopolymer transport protein ExbD
MALGKVPGSDSEEGGDGVFAEINITPLTDIFLVLLVVFMVTSTVMVRNADGGAKNGIKVNLPTGNAADVTANRSDLPVAVLADGRFVLAGTVVSREELKAGLEKAKKDNPSTMVIVQADEGVSHGKVVEVMELAKGAGLGQLAIGVRSTQK